MKKYIPFVIFCALSVLWVAFIWSNSAKSGAESGEQSSRVLGVLKGFFDSVGIDLSVSERFIRKFGHFGEYFALSVLIAADVSLLFKALEIRLFSVRALPFFVIPIALSAAVALVDEFIVQASTEGRGPSFFDVLIDTSGAAVGAALIFGLLFALNRVRNRKADGR